MTKTAKTATHCACQCGMSTQGRFAQGHDIKFVSKLLTLATTGYLTIDDAHKALASPALIYKFDAALDRRRAKVDAAAKRKAEREQARADKLAAKSRAAMAKTIDTPADVKIGRWVYPVFAADADTITYIKRDGSHGVIPRDKGKIG